VNSTPHGSEPSGSNLSENPDSESAAPGEPTGAAEGATPEPGPAGNSRPFVDLYQAAQYIADSLMAVDEAYGRVPKLEPMLKAAERDSSVYGSLLRQVQLSVDRMGNILVNAGLQPIRATFPLAEDDIAALAGEEPTPRTVLQLALTALILVVQEAVAQLYTLQRPTGSPNDKELTETNFDPTYTERMRGWMLQASRLTQHSAIAASAVVESEFSHFDHEAELNWLNRSADTCIAHGLHEAALLYLAASAAVGESGCEEAELPSAPWRELATNTLSRFASGDSQNASAAAVLLVDAIRKPADSMAPVASAETNSKPSSSGTETTQDRA
jgi:hypothetical protein